MVRRATNAQAIHQVLLSFALWSRHGLKDAIQNVIELQRANTEAVSNTVLTFVVPYASNFVVERYVIEVVQAWELLNKELKRQDFRVLGTSHKDYRHLKRIRNKLVTHKIEESSKTGRHEGWYKRTYGSYEAVLGLVERAAERVACRIDKLEASGYLYAKNISSPVHRVITQQDIEALLSALKEHGIY